MTCIPNHKKSGHDAAAMTDGEVDTSTISAVGGIYVRPQTAHRSAGNSIGFVYDHKQQITPAGPHISCGRSRQAASMWRIRKCTHLGDVHEAGAVALKAEESTVAHDVLHLGGDELARVLREITGRRGRGRNTEMVKNRRL